MFFVLCFLCFVCHPSGWLSCDKGLGGVGRVEGIGRQECKKIRIKMLITLKITVIRNGHIRTTLNRLSGWVRVVYGWYKWCVWYTKMFGIIHRFEVRQCGVTKLTQKWHITAKEIDFMVHSKLIFDG